MSIETDVVTYAAVMITQAPGMALVPFGPDPNWQLRFQGEIGKRELRRLITELTDLETRWRG